MTAKAAVLAALAPKEEIVEIGGVQVVVRELASAAETEALRDGKDATYKFMVLCCFEPGGAPLFSDEDIPSLKGRSRKGLSALVAAVARVNGFDLEHAEKNSEAGATAG